MDEQPDTQHDEHRDELPSDLDVTGYVGPYVFPNNNRRRIPGLIYLGTSALCFVGWVLRSDGGVLVNRGLLIAAVFLALVGAYHLAAGVSLEVDQTDALVAATREVGFAVGHASAQLGWRGLLSRPTWRILLYSAEDPPERRGLVLVDGVDGRVIGHFVEKNPEDWAAIS